MMEKREFNADPQRLINIEDPALLKHLPTLIELLLRKLSDEFEDGFYVLDRLHLEHLSTNTSVLFLLPVFNTEAQWKDPFLGRHQSALEGLFTG